VGTDAFGYSVDLAALHNVDVDRGDELVVRLSSASPST
jgi:hypothetical protein